MKVLERCERDLRQMARAERRAAVEPIREERLFAASRRTCEFIPIALASSPGAAILKISVLPTNMLRFSMRPRKPRTSALPWAAMARGVGVIYFALLPPERSEETLARVARATNRILAECAALGGNATIPWCPAEWKSALPVWGPERGDFEQMRKLKNVFDPRRSRAGPIHGEHLARWRRTPADFPAPTSRNTPTTRAAFTAGSA